jgi:predicted ATPase/class 3 adenylate cyclase
MYPEGRAAEIDNLKKAVEALEGRREILGEAVVETAIGPLRSRIAELEAEASPASRRTATALLGDISGFTMLGESMDAEVLSGLMNEVWAVLDSVVAEHGGIVDKHMGDSVLAIWGSVAAREDDAEMALRAALGMQARLSDLGGRLVSTPGFPAGRSLQMRIAVHSGPVFVGETGSRGERTSMGDTMNTVSRLEKLAPPGGVLASEDAWKLVRNLFEGVEQAPVRLRGKADELRTWVVGRALPRGFADATRGLGLGEAPMIGREKELGVLIDLFGKADQPGSPGLAVVAGEAGIGKSRLIREFEKIASAMSPQAVFLRGRSTPGMMSTPYGAIRDMVFAWLGLTESCVAEDALVRMIDLTGGALDSRRADNIMRLLGYGSSSSQTPVSAEGDLLFFFNSALRENRAIMLLEDMHWADDATLRLVQTLVRERPGRGFLAVCTTRPVLFEKFARWGNPAAGHSVIRLEPLGAEDCRALMESILSKPGDIASDLSRAVIGKADGNPFFIEEILRMLLDGGAVSVTGDGWSFTAGESDSRAAVIPPTLNGVLLARLDSLPASEKEMLQHASVIGREFWDSALADVSGIPPAVVGETLRSLEARQLVIRSPRSCFDGSSEFGFRHSLFRDAVYETVLLTNRREAHLRAAAWIDRNVSSSADAFQSLLASHLNLAGLPGQAAERYLRAGEGAYCRSAFTDSLRNYERGLSSVGEGSPRTRSLLLAGKGASLEKLSRYREAEKSILEAIEEARADSFGSGEARALNTLSWIYHVTGRFEEAEAAAMEALEKSRASGDRPALARALNRTASYTLSEGYSHTQSIYLQALQIYKELGDRPGQALSLLNMGNIALESKHYRDARKYYEESLAIYRILDHAWGISNNLANLGLLEQAEGRPNEAVRLGREALRRSLEIGDHENAALCLSNVASAMRESGRKVDALASYIQSLQEASRIGAGPCALRVMVEASELLLELENPDWAARLLSHVEASGTEDLDLVGKAARLLENRVRLLLSPGDFDARTRAGRETGMSELVEEAARELGRRDQPKL